MDKEILQIIENTGSGKLKYMEKQAKKKNFASVYDYLLDTKTQKERESSLAKAKLYAKETKQIFTKIAEDVAFNGKDLQTVLKAYGSISPDDMSTKRFSGDTADAESFPSYLNLKFLLEMFVTDQFGGSSNVFQKLFLEHEHLIENDEMFWTLCSTFWCISNVGFTDEIFDRNGRNKVPLERRVELITRSERFFEDRHPVHSLDYQLERLKRWDNPDVDTPVFRVFKVGSGKPVRQSVVKDHPDQYIHNEGSSWSYSFSKSLATIVGLYWNRHLIKKYAECSTDEEVEKIIRSLYNGNGTTNINDATLYDGFYQCIGLFGLEKKNIEFLTDKWGEDEIIANPENVRLVEYRFANAIDVMASGLVREWVSNKEINNTNRSSFFGIDGLFDLFHICVKKTLDDDPKVIKRVLRDNQEITRYLRIIEQKVEELCGVKLGHKIVKTGEDDFVQILLGDIPLERFKNGIRQLTSVPKKFINH